MIELQYGWLVCFSGGKKGQKTSLRGVTLLGSKGLRLHFQFPSFFASTHLTIPRSYRLETYWPLKVCLYLIFSSDFPPELLLNTSNYLPLILLYSILNVFNMDQIPLYIHYLILLILSLFK